MKLGMRLTLLMVTGLLVIMPAAYTAGYVFLLEPKVEDTGFIGCSYFSLVPHYKLADETAQRLFWPANQVDRLVRRDYWEASF